MTDQKEIFILTINDGKKSHVGNKVECSFWYTQQPENDISVEILTDKFSGLPEFGVFVDGGFKCSFAVNNLNEFFSRFFEKYISERENVKIELGLTEAMSDSELKKAVQNDSELNSLQKKLNDRLKTIGLSHGYGLIEWR